MSFNSSNYDAGYITISYELRIFVSIRPRMDGTGTEIIGPDGQVLTDLARYGPISFKSTIDHIRHQKS